MLMAKRRPGVGADEHWIIFWVFWLDYDYKGFKLPLFYKTHVLACLWKMK
jgi:hypothetical protein